MSTVDELSPFVSVKYLVTTSYVTVSGKSFVSLIKFPTSLVRSVVAVTLNPYSIGILAI